MSIYADKLTIVDNTFSHSSFLIQYREYLISHRAFPKAIEIPIDYFLEVIQWEDICKEYLDGKVRYKIFESIIEFI